MFGSESLATAKNALTISTAEVVETTLPKKEQTVKERVQEFFKDDPIMIKVAWCESRFRQFDADGSVMRGKVNSSDLGVMQINNFYHGKKSEELKFDLMTLEGNLSYGKYLYEKEGTRPWNSSSPCWATEKGNIALK